MRYSEELIEEIREKNDIVDVISSCVSLKKRGNSYFGLCPFHNEKTPSFHVSPGSQMYYCFGCGQGGNVYTFMMEYNRMSFTEALASLASRCGVELPEEEMDPAKRQEADQKDVLMKMNKDAAIYYHLLLKSPRGANAYSYLRKRGLTDETIVHFGLGYADIYRDDLYQHLKKKGYSDEALSESSLVTIDTVKGSYDQFFNRVIFPIMDPRQKVIGFGGRVMGEGQPKYLNSRETLIFDKGRNLYGLCYARRSREKRIILCEGYMDVISLHQAGFTNAVAPLGTAFTSGQAMILRRYTEEVILSFDSDEAGRMAAYRAIPILRENGIRARVLSMDPYKDPDELIKAGGAEEYRARIRDAVPGRLFEVEVLSADYDQADPEGRTRFIHVAADYLAGIEDPIERDNYITAVSKRYMIKKEDLRDLVNRYGLNKEFRKVEEESRKPPLTAQRKAKQKEDARMMPQKLLLACIYEDPSLYPVIRKYIEPDSFLDPDYRAIAIMMYDCLDRGEEIMPARIVDGFSDAKKQQKAAAVFHSRQNEGKDEDDIRKAVEELVKKVANMSLEEEMSHTNDVMKWQELLEKRAEIQKFSMF